MIETKQQSSNPLPNKKYKCILVDPPWQHETIGVFKNHGAGREIPYQTMSLQEICDMRIQDLSLEGSHLWLWTTNRFLHDSFHVMNSWGYTYLCCITWVKPSGIGAWFVNTTQHLLFGYYKKCIFNKAKLKPTHLITRHNPKRHSEKPKEFYELIESISGSGIELFARDRRHGWDAWGNQLPKYSQELIV